MKQLQVKTNYKIMLCGDNKWKLNWKLDLEENEERQLRLIDYFR